MTTRDDLAALTRERIIQARDDANSSHEMAWAKIYAHALDDIAEYVKPKPPTVTPPHDIDAIDIHVCTRCGKDVHWDDNTDQWEHS